MLAPAMALDPTFLEELRARTPLAPLIGRRVKLARSGRNWKGCCPFHGEKTPSFYVYDDHFHCFGCGVHGDAISFVMQMDGRSFPEAVQQLAGEVGLDVPQPTREGREQAVRKRGLEEVLEAAQQVFARHLQEPAGRTARDYLRQRGVSDEMIQAFGLGWAPEGRGTLTSILGGQGITPEMMAEAGLMRSGEDGRPNGELFRGRVMFPIRDRRGTLVSFGARTMGDHQPKYLNGPETGLFSKRRLLFGYDRARAALRAPKASRDDVPSDLIVVEGYMDVIALHQAGFSGAVAPLGTALTADQLEMLWQSSSSPVLCLDGDAAGRRAAVRATTTALPLLSMDRSLRLCMLPEGEDPDSLLRSGDGRMRMAGLLAGARPLSEVLFDLLAEGTPPDAGPEARAALRKSLTEAAEQITDKTLASEYRTTLLDRFFAVFRQRGRSPSSRKWTEKGGGKAGVILPAVESDAVMQRQSMLAALVLKDPSVLGSVEDAWCQLDLPESMAELRAAVLDLVHEMGSSTAEEDPEKLMQALAEEGLGEQATSVLRSAFLPLTGGMRNDGMTDAPAISRWWHFFGTLNGPAFVAEVRREIEAWTARGCEPEEWERLRPRLEAAERIRRGDDGL